MSRVGEEVELATESTLPADVQRALMAFGLRSFAYKAFAALPSSIHSSLPTPVADPNLGDGATNAEPLRSDVPVPGGIVVSEPLEPSPELPATQGAENFVPPVDRTDLGPSVVAVSPQTTSIHGYHPPMMSVYVMPIWAGTPLPDIDNPRMATSSQATPELQQVTSWVLPESDPSVPAEYIPPTSATDVVNEDMARPAAEAPPIFVQDEPSALGAMFRRLAQNAGQELVASPSDPSPHPVDLNPVGQWSAVVSPARCDIAADPQKSCLTGPPTHWAIPWVC